MPQPTRKKPTASSGTAPACAAATMIAIAAAFIAKLSDVESRSDHASAIQPQIGFETPAGTARIETMIAACPRPNPESVR